MACRWSRCGSRSWGPFGSSGGMRNWSSEGRRNVPSWPCCWSERGGRSPWARSWRSCGGRLHRAARSMSSGAMWVRCSRLLEPGLAARAEGRWLVRDAGGYRLVTDGDSSDLLRFRALREEGRRIADRSPAQALELLTEALSLWRGPLAVGIPAQARAHPAFDAVDRELPAAVRQAADAALRAGRPDAVLADLRQAAARHPLDEPLQAGLLLALAAASTTVRRRWPPTRPYGRGWPRNWGSTPEPYCATRATRCCTGCGRRRSGRRRMSRVVR